MAISILPLTWLVCACVQIINTYQSASQWTSESNDSPKMFSLLSPVLSGNYQNSSLILSPLNDTGSFRRKFRDTFQPMLRSRYFWCKQFVYVKRRRQNTQHYIPSDFLLQKFLSKILNYVPWIRIEVLLRHLIKFYRFKTRNNIMSMRNLRPI